MVEDIFIQHRSFCEAICFVGTGGIAHHYDDCDFSYPEGGAGKPGEVVTNGISLWFIVYGWMLDTRCWMLDAGYWMLGLSWF